MGPVWYKQPLINVVACLIALNMAIAIVAVAYREKEPVTTVAAGPAAASAVRPPASPPPGFTSDRFAVSNGQVDQQRHVSPGPAVSGTTGPTATSATAASGATAPVTGGTTSRRQTPATGARRGNPSTTTSPVDTPAAVTVTDTGEPVETTDTTSPSVSEPGASTNTTAKPATTTTTRPAAPGPSTQAIDDKAGDTVVDGTTTARTLPRADLRQVKANYTTKAILLAVQTAETVDPRQDARWASENTYVSWDVDTNLDGTADFIVEYFVEGGQLAADITRADDAAATSLCGVEAAFGADGYTVAIDPACVGNPTNFAYRATIYYDTSTEIDSDVAPDSGLSRPVGRPKS